MRAVLALNLNRLMEAHYASSTNRPRDLAKASGLSTSTVQRILAEEVGASLDNIEALSAVFNLSTYQLLLPNLSIGSPQAVQGATKEEERLVRHWQRAVAALNDR